MTVARLYVFDWAPPHPPDAITYVSVSEARRNHKQAFADQRALKLLSGKDEGDVYIARYAKQREQESDAASQMAYGISAAQKSVSLYKGCQFGILYLKCKKSITLPQL